MSEKMVEVLLAEDNKRDADLTLRALKRKNFANNIVWVKDGEEALDYLFARSQYSDRTVKDKPKVILLDLKMPKLDGLEVLKEIRKNEETKDIPVVMLTSSNQERDIIKSYKYGVNSYIVKPVDFEKFMKAVEEIGYYWILMNKPPI